VDEKKIYLLYNTDMLSLKKKKKNYKINLKEKKPPPPPKQEPAFSP